MGDEVFRSLSDDERTILNNSVRRGRGGQAPGAKELARRLGFVSLQAMNTAYRRYAGFDALTTRVLQFLSLRDDGHSWGEVARIAGCRTTTVLRAIRLARTTMAPGVSISEFIDRFHAWRSRPETFYWGARADDDTEGLSCFASLGYQDLTALDYLADGESVATVAHRLCIPLDVVSQRVSALMADAGCDTLQDLTRMYIDWVNEDDD